MTLRSSSKYCIQYPAQHDMGQLQEHTEGNTEDANDITSNPGIGQVGGNKRGGDGERMVKAK